MYVLVVDGAGYIGSPMVKHLTRAGARVTVLDDLSSGYRDAVAADAELVVGSAADAGLPAQLFAQHRFDAVMHFVSFIQVGESAADPAKYYVNNVAATLTLLDAMRQADVRRYTLSSTAAVYGNPCYVPIDEAHSKNPINLYGYSKWIVEQVLEDYDRACGLKSVCLRFQRRWGRPGRVTRRAACSGDASDPAGVAGRLGPAQDNLGVWHGLRHIGWHLHPRLHPCDRPV